MLQRILKIKKNLLEVKSFVGMEYNWDGGDGKTPRIGFVCFEKHLTLHLKRAVEHHKL